MNQGERESQEIPQQEPLLPKVNKEVARGILAEMDEIGEHEYFIALINRLKIENPEINSFIVKATADMEPTVRTKVMGVVYMLYRILESQIQADRLKKQLGE